MLIRFFISINFSHVKYNIEVNWRYIILEKCYTILRYGFLQILYLYALSKFYPTLIRFNLKELLITETELKDIAIAPIIGFRKPNAANRIPIVL